jgi:DNA-binding CsgD family transcriptional regulator
MAQLRMLAGDVDAAVHWGERAIAIAEPLGEDEILAHALNNVGAARLCAGDERGRAELERSLSIALDAGLEEHVARAWTNLATNAVGTMDLRRGERYLTDGIAYATERDLDSWRFYMTGWQALLHLHQGRWENAEIDCATVLRQPRISAVNRIGGLMVLGRLRARRGDPDAMAPLDEALALAKPTGEAQRLGPVHCARAEAAWFGGDYSRMRSEAAGAVALLANTGDRWLRSEATYWLWLAGEPVDTPDALTEPFALEVQGDGMAAATAWEALGCPYDAARARLRSDVETEVRDALATFDRLGAEPAAGMAMRRLREIGARSPRLSTRTHPSRLTSREAEILELIAGGHTNRQIAHRLYLSPKTVEHHVSAILGKLGVPTRQEAARAAVEITWGRISQD